MRIHFINVGYGEAILLTRGDFVMLIDGGTNREEEYKNFGCIRVEEYIKKVKITKIDVALITHLHDDHVGGIVNIIKEFPVKEVWINVKPKEGPGNIAKRFLPIVEGNLSGMLFRNALESYTELLKECESRKIPIFQKGSLDGKIYLDDNFFVELLSPNADIQNETARLLDRLFLEEDMKKAEELFYGIDRDGNKTSISLRVKAGKVSVLLSGDKQDGWEEVYKEYGEGLKSQILKITHHGQMDGMPHAMVDAAEPEHFVICASCDRRFGSAHPTVIERAYSYLKQTNKTGGVYITGNLENGVVKGGGICGVCFICDDKTGEIRVQYIEK